MSTTYGYRTRGKRNDPISRDIVKAVEAGHFSKPRSRLSKTPTEKLYADVQMMSRRERLTFLANIGNITSDVSISLPGARML